MAVEPLTEAALTRHVAIRRLLLVYLYVLLFSPGIYLSGAGMSKLYLDWIVLLFAVAVSIPYWHHVRWARAGLAVYLGYVIWNLTASVVNPDSVMFGSVLAAFGYVFGLLRPALLILAFASLIRGGLEPGHRAEVAGTVWRHLLALTGVFGVLALLQVFGPRSIHGFFMAFWPRRDERFIPDAPEGAAWPSVTFDGYYHVFGVFMAIVATYCLASASATDDRRQRGIAAFGFLVAAATVLVSQSRAAMGGLLVGLIALLVLGDRVSRRSIVRMGLVPIALLLIALAVGMLPGKEGSFDPAYVLQKYQTVFSLEGLAGGGEGTGTQVGRVLYWQLHIKRFFAHPILGSGGYAAVSDSMYLVLLGQSGIVGAALLMTSFGFLAKGLQRLRRAADPHVRLLGTGNLAMLVVGLVGAYGVNCMSGERLGEAFYFSTAVWLGAFYEPSGDRPS